MKCTSSVGEKLTFEGALFITEAVYEKVLVN